MTPFSSIVIGDESLLITCSDLLLARGHTITVVVSRDPDIAAWAQRAGLQILTDIDDLTDAHASDWVFSIANLKMLGAQTLRLGKNGAINFHDGPLPAYAGLNTPAWAIWNNETRYGVSWHLMEDGADRGDLLAQQFFDIADADTAYSLNAKCYAAGIESFETLLVDLEGRALNRTPQNFEHRSYFGKSRRFTGAGRLNFSRTAASLMTGIRAMDFGKYWNPLTLPKLETAKGAYYFGQAQITDGPAEPAGTVLTVDANGLDVACAEGALRLRDVTDASGTGVDPRTLAAVGDVLPVFDDAEDNALTDAFASIAKHDDFWRAALGKMSPARLSLATRSADAPEWTQLPVDLGEMATEAALIWAQISSEDAHRSDIAVSMTLQQTAQGKAPAYFADWAPLSQGDAATKSELLDYAKASLAEQAQHQTFSRDLILRDPGLRQQRVPDIALAAGGAPVEGSVITLTPDTGQMHFDATRLSAEMAGILAARLAMVAEWLASASDDTPLSTCPRMARSENELIEGWNKTGAEYNTTLTVPSAFEAQAAKTPEAPAVVFEDQVASYSDLNARADAIAHALVAKGVQPGSHVGLFCPRSIDMVAAAIAVMKTGAAYVPLDPTYPADRIAHYIQDSAAQVIVTEQSLTNTLPQGPAQRLVLNDVPETDQPFKSRATSDDIAYLIYTSGSTGLPKGVMVTHRNVTNFFTGMDAEIDMSLGTTWAAVTSLAFDISVLELFYTLTRGFKVVLIGDENRAAVSNGPIRLPGKKIDFNLFYWGNDDGVGRDKYALLLEGAKFADAHGFNAVWTPERHFHAFGGPYPNPSVTGAAVAAVTRNLSVRAGSCVAPLHHTARIAEEWAVIDNLTNGRAGLAIASGWQPDDFVLRPENAPPDNKPAMYRSIEELRALWRGNTVEFPKGRWQRARRLDPAAPGLSRTADLGDDRWHPGHMARSRGNRCARADPPSGTEH